MQFREQGKKIRCIRSTLDPVTKRYPQKMIAVFDSAADEVPAEVLFALTAAERQKLSTWFEARKATKAGRMHQDKVENAVLILMQLSQAIRATSMSENQVALVRKALNQVSRDLSKAGSSRPERVLVFLKDGFLRLRKRVRGLFLRIAGKGQKRG